MKEAAELRQAGATFVTGSPVVLRRELERVLSTAFENAVAALLDRHGFEREEQPGTEHRLDFFGRLRNRWIAVEAVRVSSATRLDEIYRAAAQLLLAANQPSRAERELFIVTPRPVELEPIRTRGQTIRVLSLDDLASYLEHSG